MSYTLEFPRRPLPANINSPPYALLAIRGGPLNDHTGILSSVPAAVLFHFAPKFKEWTLRPPPDGIYASLDARIRKPIIGINILADIHEDALTFIIKRMLQLTGLPCARQIFESHPTILLGARILKAWHILELPPAGAQGLETHLLTKMMLGPHVSADEMVALWDACPPPNRDTSPVLREMVHNYIRGFARGAYPLHETTFVRDWTREDEERHMFFMRFEDEYNQKCVERQDQFPTRDETEFLEGLANSEAERAQSGALSSAFEVARANSRKRDERSTRRQERRKNEEEARRRRQQHTEQMWRQDEVKRLQRLGSDDHTQSVDSVLFGPSEDEQAEGLEEMTERGRPLYDFGGRRIDPLTIASERKSKARSTKSKVRARRKGSLPAVENTLKTDFESFANNGLAGLQKERALPALPALQALLDTNDIGGQAPNSHSLFTEGDKEALLKWSRSQRGE